MNPRKRGQAWLFWIGAIFFQLIMTQVITFFASFAFPGMETLREDQPLVFAVFVSTTFGLGVFLGGWVAIKMHWVALSPRVPPRFLARFVGALAGAFLPLFIGLFIPSILQIEGAWPSLIASLLGFYLAGYNRKQQMGRRSDQTFGR